jgi:hypothetical protein
MDLNWLNITKSTWKPRARLALEGYTGGGRRSYGIHEYVWPQQRPDEAGGQEAEEDANEMAYMNISAPVLEFGVLDCCTGISGGAQCPVKRNDHHVLTGNKERKLWYNVRRKISAVRFLRVLILYLCQTPQIWEIRITSLRDLYRPIGMKNTLVSQMIPFVPCISQRLV